MGKREYNDARKAANKRYIDEKTDEVRARLPRGYADKLNKIAELAGTSKAQALKNAIDTLYSAMFDEWICTGRGKTAHGARVQGIRAYKERAYII